MTRRTMLAALGGVAVAPASLLARAQKASDPLSGSWGPGGETLLELKYDGKQTVSGTTFWGSNNTHVRFPIKKGSFDAKTGALKLEGDGTPPDGGDTVHYVIEGKLENDTLAGTYTFGTHKGTFTFKRQ